MTWHFPSPHPCWDAADCQGEQADSDSPIRISHEAPYEYTAETKREKQNVDWLPSGAAKSERERHGDADTHGRH